MAVNGEIYNHKELIASVQQSGLKSGVGFEPRTGSDCEALLALYERDGLDFLSKNEVCGMYACCIYDKRTDSFVLARDHVGMIPLYYGRGTTEVAKGPKRLYADFFYVVQHIHGSNLHYVCYNSY